MDIVKGRLPGVLFVRPTVFGDQRGFFMETWQEGRYAQAGIKGPFVQDNLSFSQRGVVRGLHFQNPNPQGKLVYVLQGEVFDVAVDVRENSPTFGQWEGYILSSENKCQLWIPEGFAHGFCVISETAMFAYKCTVFYSQKDEKILRWNDPAIGIEWPLSRTSLSQKDKDAPHLSDIPAEHLPKYKG